MSWIPVCRIVILAGVGTIAILFFCSQDRCQKSSTSLRKADPLFTLRALYGGLLFE